MVTFPSTPVPNYPLDYTETNKTLVSQFDSGQEQRRQLWRFPLRNLTLTYTATTVLTAVNLWNFYKARSGSLGTFNFFEPDVDPYNTSANQHNDEYIGRGDGVTTAFDIPGILASTPCTVFINGTTYATANYSISTAAGDGGADRLNFTSAAPASTDVITVDFNGRLRLIMRFQDDNISRSHFEADLFKYGINLIEVKRSS